MAAGKNLGFFWGEKKYYLVEVSGNIPARVIAIPLTSGSPETEFAVDDIRSTALIQKAVRDEHIASGEVKLSLPASDTIIRSFLIPFMNPAEIVSAVEFEAKKYVPFNLKDLAYAYQTLTITENKVKKLRVIFVAVRREFLERCTRVLEQAGLSVAFSEPSSLSLVRALLSKKAFSADKRVAVLHIESKFARISFAHQGMIFFIREFSTGVPGIEASQQEDPQLVKARLINEVRNSIEFYNRQYPGEQIGEICVLSIGSDNPYVQWLQEELGGMAVKPIDPIAIVGSQDPADEEGAISAFGAALALEGKSKLGFNLSRKPVKPSAGFMSSGSFNISDYMGAVKTAVVCGLILGSVFILSQMQLKGLISSVDNLKSMQGQFADSSSDDIQAEIDANDKKLAGYKSISVKNDPLPIFSYIPALMPSGMWLKSMDVRFSSGSWVIDLQGSIYLPKANDEIRSVYEFVGRLKKEKKLAKYFTNVNLKKLDRDQNGDFISVSFGITCS